MEDTIVPTDDEKDEMVVKSWNYWHSLVQDASRLPREDHSHGKSSSVALPFKMFPTLRISNSISNSLADIKA
jgi:hypothetical protein